MTRTPNSKRRTSLTPSKKKEAFVFYKRHGQEKTSARFDISATSVYNLARDLKRLDIDVDKLVKAGSQQRASPKSSRSRARGMTEAEKIEVAKYAIAHGPAKAAAKFKISPASCSRWATEWKNGKAFGSTASPTNPKGTARVTRVRHVEPNTKVEFPPDPADLKPTEDQTACLRLCLAALGELSSADRVAVVEAIVTVRKSGMMDWLPETVMQ